jgi:hypothetical protein
MSKGHYRTIKDPEQVRGFLADFGMEETPSFGWVDIMFSKNVTTVAVHNAYQLSQINIVTTGERILGETFYAAQEMVTSRIEPLSVGCRVEFTRRDYINGRLGEREPMEGDNLPYVKSRVERIAAAVEARLAAFVL